MVCGVLGCRVVCGVRSLLSFSPPPHTLARFHVPAAGPPTLYHKIEDGVSGTVCEVAYKKTNGLRDLGLVYIPGFMSHKDGFKAQALHTFSQKYGFPYVRYDPSGLGESRGVNLTDVKFSMWLEDATQILQNVTEGPQIIVASSMGCWVSCLLASKLPEKIRGVVMLSPAINFHIRYEKMLLSQLPPEAFKKYKKGGFVNLYVPDYGEFPLLKAQFQDMGEHALKLEQGQVELTCPIRIVHGMKDKDVPYHESLTLVSALQSQDVELIYMKESAHRLQDPASLHVIYDTILRLDHRLHHPPQSDNQ